MLFAARTTANRKRLSKYAEKLGNPKIKYEYSLTNIAVAMLAKLDGVPWRLHVPVKNELIVGVGAFKRKVDGVQYMGGI